MKLSSGTHGGAENHGEGVGRAERRQGKGEDVPCSQHTVVTPAEICSRTAVTTE